MKSHKCNVFVEIAKRTHEASGKKIISLQNPTTCSLHPSLSPLYYLSSGVPTLLFVSCPPSDRPHLACHRAATAWPSQVVLQLGNFHLLIELPPPFWGRYRFQEDHLKSTVHPKEKILKWSEFEEKHMDFPKKDATKQKIHSSGTAPN